jgi:flagellar secretion chaperone FliS
MSQTAYDAYLESRIESAEPVQLVRLLYQGALGAVRDARRHLVSGEIAARSHAVSKAFEILAELMTSLDRDRGGEIAVRLAQLYDYMQRRLLEANARQQDEPLAEVVGLLTTLAEAWQGIGEANRPAEPAPGPWTQMAGAETAEVAVHAWSA